MNLIKSVLSRKLFWLVLMYFGLLVWSGIYRSNLPALEIQKDKKTVAISAIGSDRARPEKVLIAYKESKPEIKTSGIPVILIHGSPGSADAFDGLTKLISDRRLISVDLPGFGDSSMEIPDYSILAHSKYVIALMNKLEIEKAHFVGFSLGGGVVLHIDKQVEHRVESISFIGSIGVQEYELFGNYWANHIAHGAQLSFFLILRNLTPHFGIFDGMMISYARNFYDTDQRPLRKILEATDKPFQIIHGKRDPLVPVEAAREHARIVPQSEYHELEDDHFFIFQRPEKIDKLLQDFWARVERGEAKTHANADAKRIDKSKEPFKPNMLAAKGPTIVVFFLLIVFLTFVNEDFAFLIAGFFAGQGRFGLEFAIIVSILGSLLSIILMFIVGRFFGKGITKTLDSSVSFLDALKRKIFSLHFLTYFKTGKTRQGFWRTLLWFSFSATVWAAILNSASYFLTKLFF